MFRKLFVLAATLLILGSLASAQVMINEIYYDNPGAEQAAVKYVEIFGPPDTDLTDWTLVGINGNGGSEYLTVELTGQIPADGYYVVGGADVANVDQIADIDLQNAGFGTDVACDGLDLRNGATVVDRVCYGECGDGETCNGEGGTWAPDYDPPSQGPAKSIGRFPDHQDTNDNGADFAMLEPLSPGQPNSGVPCDPQYVTLSDIRENDANGVSVLSGEFVVFRGIVNVNNYTLDSLTESNFYVQDEDAGINIFRGPVPAGISVGDCVAVSGWVGQYNGLTEILSSGTGNCIYEVEIVDEVDAPEPIVLTCASFFESFEGMLAVINNVTIVDGDWPGQGQFANLTITDGNGTLTLRIDDDTNVDGSPEPQGAFNVTGIITQFDNSSPYSEGYQITPRSASDINTLSADNPHDVSGVTDFRLLGAYPNPFNSVTQIRFEVGSARDLTLRIFDIVGRELASETLSNLTTGVHSYSWSPTGATGLYFIQMENGAKVQTAKVLYLK